MSWALDLLGLSADADVASVKRAYARLLRTTRPDDDAEAFQRLHSAYRQVLMHAQAREAAPTANAAVAVHPTEPAHFPRAAEPVAGTAARHPPGDGTTGATAPVATETMASVNPAALANRLLREAGRATDERALAHWLSAQPELWSLRTKQQTGEMLLQQLFSAPAPMAPAFLDTLLEFFDLHQVQSGVNPFALAQLRQRQQAMWFMLPENHRACARKLGIPTGQSPDARVVKACLRLLQFPWRWYHVPWPAIRRGRVATTARLIHGFCGGRLSDLPPQIEQRQADFWYRAARSAQPSWPRFIVGSARALFLGTILFSGVALACILVSVLGHTGIEWYAALGIGAIIAAGSISIWLVYAAWMWLDYWQRQPEPAATRHPWLRRALIPALCLLGIAADFLPSSHLAAMSIIIPTALLMLRRFAHRLPPRRVKRQYLRLAAFLPGASLVLAFLAKLATTALPPDFFDHLPLVAIASGTLCLWLADMWRQRSHLGGRVAS